MARKLTGEQHTLLRNVIADRRPALLDILLHPESLPLSVRNDLREVIGEELVEVELINNGEDVTPRGRELEYLIDALGPTLEGE